MKTSEQFYSDIIRRHYHGISDATWELRKDEYPYCEIPAIIQDVLNAKLGCPECAREEEQFDRRITITTTSDDNINVKVENLSNIECMGIVEFLKNKWLKGEK